MAMRDEPEYVRRLVAFYDLCFIQRTTYQD